MKNYKLYSALVLVGCGVGAGASEENFTHFPAKRPTIYVSPLAGPMVVDGKFTEKAWENCVEVRDLPCLASGLPGANGASFRVGYTAEKLFLAIECPGRTTKPVADVREHDGLVYCDDCIELYLRPDLSKPDYFHFVGNALGTRYEARGMADKGWNGNWEAAVSTAGGTWRMELAIPFTTLELQPSPGKVVGFNLIRTDKSSGGEPLSWCGTYHQPDSWGQLALGGKAFGLSGMTLQRTKDSALSLTAALSNPGAEAAQATMVMSLRTLRGSLAASFMGEAKGAATLPLLATTASNAVTVSEKVAVAIAVSAEGKWLYISPPRQYAVATFPAQSAGERAILENDAVRLVFDAGSGDLISMIHKPSGLDLRPRREPAAVFALEVVPFRANSIFFSPDRTQTLKPDATTCRECRVEGRRLRQKHVFPSGLEATVLVELPEQGEVSRWQIELDNKPTWHPSQAMIVYRTLFPRLIGLRTDEQPEKMKLAIPQICGLLVPDPVVNLSKMPAYGLLVEPAKAGSEYKAGRYAPGYPSMTWEDLSGPRAGIYLASHDVKPMIATCPESASDLANKEIELSIRRMTLNYPGETWKPAACSVGVHGPEGWHWAADRYREWFYSTVKVRPLPKWLRESSGWIESGGGGGAHFNWDEFPDHIRRAKPYGMAYIEKWQNSTGDDLSPGGGLSCDYAVFPFPNPYCGSFEKFKAALERVHKLGGRVGFYHNMLKSDAVVGKFMRWPRYSQKIPAGVLTDENPYANGWVDSAKMGADGGYAANGVPLGNHLDGMWWCCPGAKPWMDFQYEWMARRWSREYGLDACYLDSCSPAALEACFNPRHGMDGPLGRPHDEAQFSVNFYKRLAEGADKDYGILQEFVWDRLMGYGTHSLATFTWSGNGNATFSEPAIFRYVHPQYPLYSGVGNFFSGPNCRNMYDGILTNATWPESLSYVFLYGSRFDHWGMGDHLDQDFPRELMTPEAQEEKDLLLLRYAVNEDLNDDDFRDMIGLSGLPDRVFSRVFVRGDRSAALLTLVDLREKRAAFTLALDLKAHGMKRAVGAEIVRGGGTTSPLPAPAMKGAVAEVAIPVDAGKTAAIRILTK